MNFLSSPDYFTKETGRIKNSVMSEHCEGKKEAQKYPIIGLFADLLWIDLKLPANQILEYKSISMCADTWSRKVLVKFERFSKS